MEGLPGWVISPMPGPPPRQHKHERQYTPSTLSVIPTRRIWNDDYYSQMIFGDLGGLKFPDICLTGEEKPRKTLIQETCPDRGSNPGPLRDKRACYHLLHSGGPFQDINDCIILSLCSQVIFRNFFSFRLGNEILRVSYNFNYPIQSTKVITFYSVDCAKITNK